MKLHRSARYFAVAALLVGLVPATVLAATTTVVVTPANQQGWITDTTVLGNPAVPTTFAGPADSGGGLGSFQFGPIGPVPQAKQEMQPPEVNVPVGDFGGLRYEFNIVTPVGPAPYSQFYANVYVDVAENGIGFFGTGLASTGFYDCRYGYVPTSSTGTWTLFSFNGATVPTAFASRHPACAPTLGGNSGDVIEFFRLNGGDAGPSGSDNGLVGAYDLVGITISGNTTLYDFEPYIVASDKDGCKNGGWQTLSRADGSGFKNQGDCTQYVNTGK